MKPESEWTRPTELCPHPERWHSNDAQSTEYEVSELVGGFVRALQPDYVVETGACIGITSGIIGQALLVNGQGRLDTIEIYEGRCKTVRERCVGLPVTVHHGDSMQFTPADTIGFAWLDSLTDLRIAEFERYRPWMRPGTIVGFHDTAPHHGAWSLELHRLPGTNLIELPTPRGVSFVQVVS